MASTAPELHPPSPETWFAQDEAAVVAALETGGRQGLTAAEAAARLSRHGPNEITGEKPPSVWRIALEQLREPMNIMLVAVTAVSFAIGEVPTAILVALLILLNLVLGSRQELKARASVDALAKLQVPQSRVVRDGSLVMIPARELVPETSSSWRRATSCRRMAGASARPRWSPRRRRSPGRARRLRKTRPRCRAPTSPLATAPTCCSRTRR